MTVQLATPVAPNDASPQGRGESARLTCALVNNMPDGAFDATERQYLGLLEAASGTDVLEVRRYAINGVPRGEQTSARIIQDYFPLSDIYLEPPDCVIVTGSNPIEARIQDELYWSDLVELLSWSRQFVGSTLLSCLSAHAALTALDSIDRVRLPSKCTGVFPQQVAENHPLTVGLEREIVLPHSRWNTVLVHSLENAGYDVIVQSEKTGWSIASRDEAGRSLVLVQGHPEYDPSSLLREYRRDAGRYVHHERDDLPVLPYHCVSPEDWGPLKTAHDKITNGGRDSQLVDNYPFDEVGARAPWTWHPVALRFYANWLSSVETRRG